MNRTNLFKPHIVKFSDGEYAIRRYSLLRLCYIYKDLCSTGRGHWWRREEEWYNHSRGTLDDVTRAIGLHTNKGTVIGRADGHVKSVM